MIRDHLIHPLNNGTNQSIPFRDFDPLAQFFPSVLTVFLYYRDWVRRQLQRVQCSQTPYGKEELCSFAQQKHLLSRKIYPSYYFLFPIKSAILPSRELQKIANIARFFTEQYAMHISFLSIANILVIALVNSGRALLNKYEQFG